MKYLVIIILIICQSCVTEKACERKFGPFESNIETKLHILKKDTIIFQPGRIVIDTINFNFNDTVYIRKDSIIKAEIIKYNDNYIVRIEKKRDTIKVPQTKIEVEKKYIVKTVNKIPIWIIVMLIVLTIIIILILIRI